jgi:transposase-like protein
VCLASGERLSAYARRHGFDIDEGYRWTRTLRRAGLWPVKQKSNSGAGSAIVARKSAPRFARVRIASAQETELSLPLALRLVLANGRRAELLMSDERQLPRMLRLLEEPP